LVIVGVLAVISLNSITSWIYKSKAAEMLLFASEEFKKLQLCGTVKNDVTQCVPNYSMSGPCAVSPVVNLGRYSYYSSMCPGGGMAATQIGVIVIDSSGAANRVSLDCMEVGAGSWLQCRPTCRTQGIFIGIC
jgi:hypothetical protein